VIVTALGYAALTVLMLAVGLLLTHTLSSSVGRWDESVNRWLAARRIRSFDDVTGAATVAVNTLPVIVTAAICDALLGWRRRWREAAFLTLALVLEITVFLSVTFVVARPRPDVVRLNTTPATSSFPSGHTAAATVVFAGLAVIIFCSTARKTFRVLGVVAAVIFPALVGFSRVYRGLHHPTDVLVGVIFGLACLAVAALAIRAASVRTERRKERHRPIASTTPRPVAVEQPRIAS
jgi:membrane-associated phospholipid phosphatase